MEVEAFKIPFSNRKTLALFLRTVPCPLPPNECRALQARIAIRFGLPVSGSPVAFECTLTAR